jgi:small conductance mechanosensitive channel
MIFTVDEQTISRAVPALARILFILIAAFATQQVTKQAIGRLIKIISTRPRGEEKQEFEQRIETIAGVFAATVGFVIWAAAIFIILSELGIDILPILTGAGIAGFAVAFGAQNLVRDMISGLFILTENQYTEGDIVRIGGVEGKVEEVNLRRTVLRDLDGTVHNIPNGEIKLASNLTQGYSKINLDLMVEGKNDLDSITKTVDSIGKELFKDEKFGKMIKEAPHVLRVEEIAKEGVVLKIAGKTKPVRQWDVLGEFRRRLKETFDKQEIVVYEKK